MLHPTSSTTGMPTVIRALALLLVLTICSSIGLSQKINVPPSTRHTLSNGLTVILTEYTKVPVVHFRLMTRGGSAQDPAGLEGIAGIATTLMRRGTTTRTATQLAQEVDFIGGSLSAAAGLDYCAVNSQMLKKDMRTGFDLFADITLNPVFPQEELERERKQRLAELDAIKENPGRVAGVVFNRTVYESHPYGRQTFGTRASIQSFTRDQLMSFYQKTFVPNNSTLVVVGDFVSAEVLPMIEAKFGGWKRGEESAKALPLPDKIHGKKVVVVDKPDATQMQIRIGNTGVAANHPDNFAITIANALFGSGFTSRLVDELRVKRSLTYGANSSFPGNLYGGTYSISTFTKNQSLGQTVDVILDEIRKFRDKGATPDEVKKSQNYVAGGFARSLQSPEAIASNITNIELYGFPKDYLGTYIERLRAVSQMDVQRVVRDHFLLDDLLFVFVGPAKESASVVERYGPATIIELKDAIQ